MAKGYVMCLKTFLLAIQQITLGEITYEHLFAAPLGLAMVAMATAPVVQGADLILDDSVENAITIKHDGNFELGVTSNGTTFDGEVGGSTTVSGEDGTFSGRWRVNNGGDLNPGSGIIYIVESGTNVVKATIEAQWTIQKVLFVRNKAAMDVQVTSSACGTDLGTLPLGFTGLNDPQGVTGIVGSFLDATAGTPVTIPGNISMSYISSADSDCDGVNNVDDYCPDTVIPEAVPSIALGNKRYALVDEDFTFDTVKGDGVYTTQDTGGCSCEQIIDELEGLRQDQTRIGCNDSDMKKWINSLP